MGEFAIGQGVSRFEDPRLIRGGGRYVDDIKLPGMAHGVVLVEHAGVPDGHLPTGERDDLARVRLVPFVERGALERRILRFGPGKFGQMRVLANSVQPTGPRSTPSVNGV